MTDAYIYEAIRTPRGKQRKGSLHSVKPVDLIVGLINELKVRFPDMDPADIDDVVLGVVSPVGEQGAVIPRTAALVAGLPDTVPGTQINRFCASGLEATNLAAQKVASGWDNLVIAGGVRVDVFTGETFDGGDQVCADALRGDVEVVGRGGVGEHRATVAAHGHARHGLDAAGDDQVVPA